MDNRDCCNINCNFLVRKNKLRCGKCSRRSDYRCAMCNSQVRVANKIFCDNCIKIRQQVISCDKVNSNSYQELYCIICNKTLVGQQTKYCSDCRVTPSKPYPKCLMCDSVLPKRINKVCQGGDCLRIYKNLQMIVRRGKKHITN